MATGTKSRSKVSRGASKKVGNAKRQRKRGALSSGLRAARDLLAGAVAIGIGLVPSKKKSSEGAKKTKATQAETTRATKKRATKKKSTKKKSTRTNATKKKTSRKGAAKKK